MAVHRYHSRMCLGLSALWKKNILWTFEPKMKIDKNQIKFVALFFRLHGLDIATILVKCEELEKKPNPKIMIFRMNDRICGMGPFSAFPHFSAKLAKFEWVCFVFGKVHLCVYIFIFSSKQLPVKLPLLFTRQSWFAERRQRQFEMCEWHKTANGFESVNKSCVFVKNVWKLRRSFIICAYQCCWPLLQLWLFQFALIYLKPIRVSSHAHAKMHFYFNLATSARAILNVALSFLFF